MQDLNSRELIGTGKCQHGLYRMKMVGHERKAMSASVGVWHKRPGHASSGKLSWFDFVDNASFNTVDCDSCAKAKHTRLPFPISCIKSKECFELLHCDIWGRYRTPSLSRANYFLTIDVLQSTYVFSVYFSQFSVI
ncbi:hypothetical protein Hanom_Chr06g00509221 [Helianthus anomalus]